MSICCCSLAGTAACKTCMNNPNADLTNLNHNIVTTGTIINYPNEQFNRIPEKVIRCKNCKYYGHIEDYDTGEEYPECYHPDGGGVTRGDDWYCVDGESKY